jgi:hypothetical protein
MTHCPRCSIRLDELNPMAPGCDYCGLCAWEQMHSVRERIRAQERGDGPEFTMKLIALHRPRFRLPKNPVVRRRREKS